MKKVSLFLGLLFVAFTAVPLAAQPYGAFLVRSSGHGYVEVPASSAFDFTTGFTLEAWVTGSDTGSCTSIAGKNYTQAWWIGVCGTTDARPYPTAAPSSSATSATPFAIVSSTSSATVSHGSSKNGGLASSC
jgi:hypothetical protein